MPEGQPVENDSHICSPRSLKNDNPRDVRRRGLQILASVQFAYPWERANRTDARKLQEHDERGARRFGALAMASIGETGTLRTALSRRRRCLCTLPSAFGFKILRNARNAQEIRKAMRMQKIVVGKADEGVTEQRETRLTLAFVHHRVHR